MSKTRVEDSWVRPLCTKGGMSKTGVEARRCNIVWGLRCRVKGLGLRIQGEQIQSVRILKRGEQVRSALRLNHTRG